MAAIQRPELVDEPSSLKRSPTAWRCSAEFGVDIRNKPQIILRSADNKPLVCPPFRLFICVKNHKGQLHIQSRHSFQNGISTPALGPEFCGWLVVAVYLHRGWQIIDLRLQNKGASRAVPESTRHHLQRLLGDEHSKPTGLEPFWEWPSQTQATLRALLAAMQAHLHMTAAEAEQALIAHPRLSFRRLVLDALHNTQPPGNELVSLDRYIEQHWPAALDVMKILQPRQVAELWPHPPELWLGIADYLSNYQEETVASVLEFVKARKELQNLRQRQAFDPHLDWATVLETLLHALESAPRDSPEQQQSLLDQCRHLVMTKEPLF